MRELVKDIDDRNTVTTGKYTVYLFRGIVCKRYIKHIADGKW